MHVLYCWLFHKAVVETEAFSGLFTARTNESGALWDTGLQMTGMGAR